MTRSFRYIIAKNLTRRYLNASQRALIAAELANMARGGDRRSEDFKTSVRDDELTSVRDTIRCGLDAGLREPLAPPERQKTPHNWRGNGSAPPHESAGAEVPPPPVPKYPDRWPKKPSTASPASPLYASRCISVF